MNFRNAFAVFAFGAVIVVAELLTAQQPQPGQAQPRQPAQPGQVQPQQGQIGGTRVVQPGQHAAWQGNDHFLASCVAIANQEEIAIAKFAKDKLHNDDVKDFAQMLIEDHQEFLQKLNRWAPEASREGFLEEQHAQAQGGARRDLPEGRQAQPQQGNPQFNQQQNQPQVRPGAAQQPGGVQPQAAQTAPIDHIQLAREIAMECIDSAKEGLSEKSDKDGKDVDLCFLGHQIVAHQHMQDKLTVFQRHASGQLAELFGDASSTVDKHQQHADELMDQLMGKSSTPREARKEKRTEKD